MRAGRATQPVRQKPPLIRDALWAQCAICHGPLRHLPTVRMANKPPRAPVVNLCSWDCAVKLFAGGHQ